MNQLSPLDRIRIVLSHTSHPGNLGAAARAMKTMGLSRLYLVRPKEFPSAEADARASGAADVLANAVVCETLEEALTGTVFAAALTARRREMALPVAWPRQAAADLVASAALGQEVALVFGNETSGLSNEDVLMCQLPVTIPTNPSYSSLNLGAAVQVLCYELRQAAVDPGQPPAGVGEWAPVEDQERFFEHLQRAMIGSGFLDPVFPKKLMARLRRLFGRAKLEKDEVAILRGMLSAFETGPYQSPNQGPNKAAAKTDTGSAKLPE